MKIISHYRVKILRFFEEHQNFIFWSTLILIFLFGVIYSIYLGDVLRFGDEEQYVSIVNNLIDHGVYSIDGIHPTAFRTPGYILPLALLHLLGGGIFSYRIFNFIVLLFSIWFLGTELSKEYSPIAKPITVISFMLYPVILYTAGTLYPQTLQLSLMMVLLVIGTKRIIKPLEFLICGFLIAWMFLTTPTTIFIALGLGIYWLISRVKISNIILTVLSASLIVGLWSYRCYVALGEPFIISTNFGINFLIGNSRNSQPNIGPNADVSEYTKNTSTLSEIEKDRFFKNEAINWMRENPDKAIKLYFLKVLNYFNFRNELYTKNESSGLRDLLMFFTYYFLLILVGLRIWLRRKIPLSHLEIFSLLIYLINAFVGAIVFNRVRYRLPFDALLIILAINLFISLLYTSGRNEPPDLLTSSGRGV